MLQRFRSKPPDSFVFFKNNNENFPLTLASLRAGEISGKSPPMIKEMEKPRRPPLPLQSQITRAPLVTVHLPQLIFNRGEATLSPSCLFHISGVTPSLSPSASLQLSLTRTLIFERSSHFLSLIPVSSGHLLGHSREL